MSETTFQNNLPVIQIVTTGGTIASRIDADTGGAVPAVGANELLLQVPALGDFAEIRTTEFSLVSSWNMSPQLIMKLADTIAGVVSRQEVGGVVVTHGTDTMEETAFALDLLIDSEKPVILTGGMRNADQIGADGPANLLAAVRLAVYENAMGLGVTIVMNDKIHAARFASKTHTTALDTFKSIGAAPLGSIDDQGVRLVWRPSIVPKLSRCEPESKVYLIKMAIGMDDLFLRAALDSGARGVVIEGTGAGNVFGEWEGGIASLLKRDVPVVLVSRCQSGRIVPAYGGEGGGETLRRIGVIDGGFLSGQKARIALMLALGGGMDINEVREYFAVLTQ